MLGVAGGDGTQGLVAGIAAEHGIPFMVITAGTRNHFALDLGLDRDDPAACLAALSDGVDLLVDLGEVGGRTFVNNASFGAYAEVVDTPAYRDDKLATTLDLLPDLLQGHEGARLTAHAEEVDIDSPQALLVANNPYGTGDLAGLSRRARLDGGVLSVVAITIDSARQAAGLFRGRRATGLTVRTTHQVTVIVRLGDTTVAHLLAWELLEVDGSWHAWISWVSEQGGRPLHKVVSVRAATLQPLEGPESYERVPRRVRGRDGVIRPWSGEIS